MIDLYQFDHGWEAYSYTYLGAHRTERGFVFRTYAPKAQGVSLISSFTGWSEMPMNRVNERFFELEVENFPDGYNTHIEQGGTNVSGGQRQRLCIARALLKKPKILILDDSTSAVDTATDASIRRAFREEIPGTTKLIIAQRISSVMDSDRIIVMDDGKINDFGTHEELLERNEIYRDAFRFLLAASD